MTVEYALTRTEIVRGYLWSIARSPRYLVTVLLYALVASVIALASTGAFRALRVRDVVIAALAGVGFLFFLPIMLFLRAKTSKRSLTISPEGISTETGSFQAQIPWKKVKVMLATDRYVLLSRASGNAFFIPSRAFSNSGQQAEFVGKIKQWAHAANAAR